MKLRLKVNTMIKINERRQRLMEYLSANIPLSEIVTRISKEFGCSERTVYTDYETRGTWMPALYQLDDEQQFLADILNRHHELIRRTTQLVVTSGNDAVRIAALKLLRNLNLDLFKMIIPVEIEKRIAALEDSLQYQLTGGQLS